MTIHRTSKNQPSINLPPPAKRRKTKHRPIYRKGGCDLCSIKESAAWRLTLKTAQLCNACGMAFNDYAKDDRSLTWFRKLTYYRKSDLPPSTICYNCYDPSPKTWRNGPPEKNYKSLCDTCKPPSHKDEKFSEVASIEKSAIKHVEEDATKENMIKLDRIPSEETEDENPNCIQEACQEQSSASPKEFKENVVRFNIPNLSQPRFDFDGIVQILKERMNNQLNRQSFF